MQFSVLQENLNSALQNVSRFTSGKTQLPILNNILIATDGGRLKLSATNLELAINYWIGAKIDKEGSITLPSKEITEFVSYLSAGKLDFSLNDKGLLTLTSSKAESSFTTIPPADFPPIPSLNPKTAFELDLPLLTQSISQIAFAAAADDSRPVLTAILCLFTSDSLTLVATDGFRLSLKTIKLVDPIKLSKDASQFTFMVPARSLTEIVKLARAAKKIKIGHTGDEHQLVFVLEDLELVSRLIEGDFPDYQRIIPASYTTKVFINHDEFAQAVKIASVFARQSANVVKFAVKKNEIELTANALQIGQNRTTVDARVDGESLEIAFNFKFISDFLTVCKGEEIVIELNDALTPGFFHDPSDPHFTHIIMPVRIQD